MDVDGCTYHFAIKSRGVVSSALIVDGLMDGGWHAPCVFDLPLVAINHHLKDGRLIRSAPTQHANTPNNHQQVTTRKITQLGLVCGGTGITPMLQILRDILKARTMLT